MSESVERARHRVVLDAEQNQVYNPKWEKKFKWLAASQKGREHYYCKVCERHSYGGLRQITLHCTTRTHMNALVASADEVAEASVYFVESRPAKPRQRSSGAPKKRRITRPKTPPDDDSEDGSPEGSSTKKSEFIPLKSYTSPVDGKRVTLGMERRLEPLYKPKGPKVIRQAVAPYSRHCETTAAVKAIEQNEQAEAGLLIEEEPPAPLSPETLTAPLVTVKTEGLTRNATSNQAASNISRMTVLDQRADVDAFGVFGKHVANKLRTLTPEQNRFAQKLIMDVLFEGEMESLDRNTKVLKCGVSCVCQQ